MKRNLMPSRSVVDGVPGGGGALGVVALTAALALSGCDRRTYPTHPILTNVHVDASGSLEVSGQFNQCPTATFSVSPINVPADRPVDVTGSGSDPDDAGVLTFAWTATSGSFEQASARQTVFHCAEPGPVTITLVVSDGSCDTPSSGAIYCLGTHQDGGGAGGGPPDNSRDGGAGGMGGASGLGGRGMGGRPGTGGTPGTGGKAVVDTCALTPAQEPQGGANTAACDDCTTMNCSLAAPALGGTDGCCALTSAADRALCAAVVTCDTAHSQTCTSSGDPTNCFCGTGFMNCFTDPGAANGPCKAEWIAAAKTSDVRMIHAQFSLPTSVLGRATDLLLCRGSFCTTECGIQ